jgi:hypothetical protein
MAIIHRNSSVRKKTLEDFEYRLIAIFEGHFVNIFDLDAYQFGKSSLVFPYVLSSGSVLNYPVAAEYSLGLNKR